MTENMRNTVRRMRGHPSGGQCSQGVLPQDGMAADDQLTARPQKNIHCAELLSAEFSLLSTSASAEIDGQVQRRPLYTVSQKSGSLAVRIQNCNTYCLVTNSVTSAFSAIFVCQFQFIIRSYSRFPSLFFIFRPLSLPVF